MLKLKAHSGFHDLCRFWYVWEYKYGMILWLEDDNLYIRLRKMSHTIYVIRIILRPLSALFGSQFMLLMETSVTFIGACANEIIRRNNSAFFNKGKEWGHVRIILFSCLSGVCLLILTVSFVLLHFDIEALFYAGDRPWVKRSHKEQQLVGSESG